MKQLVEASGFPERSIREYVLQGMVPRPPYHGKDTLYGDVQLTALRAIAKLREEHRMFRIAPLRAWFDAKSPEEVEAFVTGVPLVQAAQAAPPPAPPPAPPAAPPEEAPVTAPEPPLAGVGERWIHLPLVPGMTLLVRDGAPEVVARLAEEIRAKYAIG